MDNYIEFIKARLKKLDDIYYRKMNVNGNNIWIIYNESLVDSNLVSNFVVKKLSDERAKFEISYLDKKGVLTYNIGNTSVIGNDFLVANPDIDFFIDITSRKTMSFRANGNADVSQMAKHLVGGGGHINASGGLFMAFKDDYSYVPIKAQIVDLITKKTTEIITDNINNNQGDENAKQ